MIGLPRGTRANWVARRDGPTRTSRAAFTLVELLVTVTILAILASLVYGAMSAAETTAKTAKTKATIAKLHRLIMARYESFKTRRIPVDVYSATSANRPLTPTEIASVRLDAIREIMRQELPERMLDITATPENMPLSGQGWQYLSSKIVPSTSIRYAYTEYLSQMNQDHRGPTSSATVQMQSSKCLYLIVTLSCPGGREQFSESEIAGDVDGWQYFIDGWGHPIGFFRWAPGFIPQYSGDSDLQIGYDPGNPRLATLQHDPFDTQNVEAWAYQLIPLIYSSGPDGVTDMRNETDATYTSKLLNSGRRSACGTNVSLANVLNSGQPYSSMGGGMKHYDNIHNHRLEIR